MEKNKRKDPNVRYECEVSATCWTMPGVQVPLAGSKTRMWLLITDDYVEVDTLIQILKL